MYHLFILKRFFRWKMHRWWVWISSAVEVEVIWNIFPALLQQLLVCITVSVVAAIVGPYILSLLQPGAVGVQCRAQCSRSPVQWYLCFTHLWPRAVLSRGSDMCFIHVDECSVVSVALCSDMWPECNWHQPRFFPLPTSPVLTAACGN